MMYPYVIVVERHFVDQSKTDRVNKLLANSRQESLCSLEVLWILCILSEDKDRDWTTPKKQVSLSRGASYRLYVISKELRRGGSSLPKAF
jgi:hypothetical protein